MPPSSTQKPNKGKQNMEKGEKGNRGKQTKQKPQFIDLDSDNEDEEMATRILLQRKDAQIRELERDFGTTHRIIQYYKNEHKYFRKVKMGLDL